MKEGRRKMEGEGGDNEGREGRYRVKKTAKEWTKEEREGRRRQ